MTEIQFRVTGPAQATIISLRAKAVAHVSYTDSDRRQRAIAAFHIVPRDTGLGPPPADGQDWLVDEITYLRKGHPNLVARFGGLPHHD